MVYCYDSPEMEGVSGSVRSVVLHRARRGFGFVLRGARARSPLMELRPSARCPALQYLDDVDAGGAAHRAGLRRGDFLVAVTHLFTFFFTLYYDLSRNSKEV